MHSARLFAKFKLHLSARKTETKKPVSNSITRSHLRIVLEKVSFWWAGNVTMGIENPANETSSGSVASDEENWVFASAVFVNDDGARLPYQARPSEPPTHFY
jgi:hypothetical protein